MADEKALVVAVFDTLEEAVAAREALVHVDEQMDVVKLNNIAVVHKEPEGSIAVTETGDMQAHWGKWSAGAGTAVALAAALTGGAILLPAVAAGGLAAVAAQFIDTGFPDTVLKELGQELDANHAMVVTLVDNPEEQEIVLTELQARGGALFQHTLAPDMVHKLGATVAAATEMLAAAGVDAAGSELTAWRQRDERGIPEILRLAGAPGSAGLPPDDPRLRSM